MSQVLLKEFIESILLEENFSRSPKITIKINDQEIEFGSEQHAQFLQQLCGNLEQVRGYYKKGSANRHVYSLSISKLKKLINNITKSNKTI